MSTRKGRKDISIDTHAGAAQRAQTMKTKNFISFLIINQPHSNRRTGREQDRLVERHRANVKDRQTILYAQKPSIFLDF